MLHFSLYHSGNSQTGTSFFAHGPIQFKNSTMQQLKNLKTFELTCTWSFGKQPSNLWILLICLQKKEKSRIFSSKKCCDWTIFFRVSQFESPHYKSILYTIMLLMVSILEPFYEALHLIRRILNKDYYTVLPCNNPIKVNDS